LCGRPAPFAGHNSLQINPHVVSRAKVRLIIEESENGSWQLRFEMSSGFERSADRRGRIWQQENLA
jgi:hypothetical protein